MFGAYLHSKLIDTEIRRTVDSVNKQKAMETNMTATSNTNVGGVGRVAIWAPDDQSPVFLALIQAMFRGMEPKGKLIPLIGSYKGESEFAFLCLESDFHAIVHTLGWTRNQESVLMVTQCNKQYAVLEYSNGDREDLGSLKSVPKEVALQQENWTYRPDVNEWFITVQDNPDTIPPAEGWNAQYIRIPKDAYKFWRNSRNFERTQPYYDGVEYSNLSEDWELCAVIPR